jgi:hypothetical protein
MRIQATSKTFDLPQGDGRKVCIAGGGGFIGSHIGKKLKENGWYVIAVGWRENEFMNKDDFCDEYILGDVSLRWQLMSVKDVPRSTIWLPIWVEWDLSVVMNLY